MSQLNDIALEALRTRITGAFPAQIVASLRELTDEQIWWRPNESSNSVGNLVLHLTGSLNHFLNHNLGGLDFTRDREKEFAERTMISRDELIAAFETMIAEANKTFAGLTPASLENASPEPKMSTIVFQDLLGIATHIAAHSAQIVYITKMLKEGSLDEVWIHSHRDTGVWKKKDA
ncbi:MAG TPA: DUF1572 family protein [Thermoanaerobaculia bacterium]